MTREEAIEILKQPDRIGCNLIKANDEESTKYNQESIEALNMAIKALKQEPSEDCISREQAIKATYGFERYTGIDEAPYEYAESILRDLPPVIPQPKMGHWIDEFGGCECSECGCLEAGYSDYCPNCGAKMQEVEE